MIMEAVRTNFVFLSLIAANYHCLVQLSECLLISMTQIG